MNDELLGSESAYAAPAYAPPPAPGSLWYKILHEKNISIFVVVKGIFL